MHAKYQVSICNGSKVMANVKVVLKQTNKQTNKQTDKQTGQKQYATQILSGGHKKISEMNFSSVNIYLTFGCVEFRVSEDSTQCRTSN